MAIKSASLQVRAAQKYYKKLFREYCIAGEKARVISQLA